METVKECKQCGVSKSVNDFGERRRVCNECRAFDERQRRVRSKESSDIPWIEVRSELDEMKALRDDFVSLIDSKLLEVTEKVTEMRRLSRQYVSIGYYESVVGNLQREMSSLKGSNTKLRNRIKELELLVDK